MLMLTLDSIIDLLSDRGGAEYGDERVTQLAHALQAAALAEAEAAEPPLIAAALLHDLGHLVANRRSGEDDRHEQIAAGILTRLFGPEVAEPVRLHVDAKRWLCATDPAYFATLSPASVRSLELQGGPFSAAEADAFGSHRHAEAAIRLRRWDDRAKRPNAPVKPVGEYRRLLRRLAH
jgi:phosphonate degradation associated HDIG domain protein